MVTVTGNEKSLLKGRSWLCLCVEVREGFWGVGLLICVQIINTVNAALLYQCWCEYTFKSTFRQTAEYLLIPPNQRSKNVPSKGLESLLLSLRSACPKEFL